MGQFAGGDGPEFGDFNAGTWIAWFWSEMVTVLVILGLIAVGLGIGLVVASTAPAGYQDETGFHYGQLDGIHEEEGIPCVVHQAPQPKLA
jgi:hypothetical protein